MRTTFNILKTLILAWYDTHKRDLPWRAVDRLPNPYHTLISEIMLQQTGVITVIPYFERFIEKFPSINALADATLDEVYHYWQGLGYYRRAHYLHTCAKALHDYDTFPSTPEELLTLPGIGPYTSSSIAAIAFNYPTMGVDGNLERVFSRVFEIKESGSLLKKACQKIAHDFDLTSRSGDLNQALMDLGANICKPRAPHCSQCPIQKYCLAYQHNHIEQFPHKVKKTKVPTRRIDAYVVFNDVREVLLEKRAATGLFANMVGVPCKGLDDAPSIAIISDIETWHTLPEKVVHIFSHFKAEVTIHVTFAPDITFTADIKEYLWGNASPSTFMNKIIKAAKTTKKGVDCNQKIHKDAA